jgi:phosphocarrier protein HPr
MYKCDIAIWLHRHGVYSRLGNNNAETLLQPTMIESKITIINKFGLHARAAAKFVNTAKAFSSTISIGRDGELIDGKSIMSVMMLAASQGTELDVQIEGADEEDALHALQKLINNYFDEGE